MRFKKDPDATLDYSVDWTEWLVEGDVITTCEVIADPPLELVGAPVIAEGKTSQMIRGGTEGESHKVVFSVATSEGRQDQRTITLSIRNR